jgi:hypothetical protein
MISKCIIENMMINTIKHCEQRVQPTLGGTAYWLVTSAPMFNSDSINGKERNRVREGWDG